MGAPGRQPGGRFEDHLVADAQPGADQRLRHRVGDDDGAALGVPAGRRHPDRGLVAAPLSRAASSGTGNTASKRRRARRSGCPGTRPTSPGRVTLTLPRGRLRAWPSYAQSTKRGAVLRLGRAASRWPRVSARPRARRSRRGARGRSPRPGRSRARPPRRRRWRSAKLPCSARPLIRAIGVRGATIVPTLASVSTNSPGSRGAQRQARQRRLGLVDAGGASRPAAARPGAARAGCPPRACSRAAARRRRRASGCARAASRSAPPPAACPAARRPRPPSRGEQLGQPTAGRRTRACASRSRSPRRDRGTSDRRRPARASARARRPAGWPRLC